MEINLKIDLYKLNVQSDGKKIILRIIKTKK